MFKRWVIGLGFAEIACACGGATPALTPRLEDAAAPRDFYRSLNPDKPKCDPAPPILHQSEVGGRKYRELSALSATCSPGAPGACRRTLSDRACELKADALILDDVPEGPVPAGASGQSESSLSARAVTWTVE